MAKNKNQFFDIIRTKAWVAQVGIVCGSESSPLSPDDLMGRTWGKSGADFSFDKWASGSIVVSEMSLNLVDQCLESEGKGRCKDVFTRGPDSRPFWTLLFEFEMVEGFPESLCNDIIAFYLYTPERGMEMKRAVFSGKPFAVRVEELWAKLVGNLRADFAGYDSGEEGNAVFVRIEQGDLEPSLDLFAVLLAVRQIAERRRECREMARYMSDACYGMLDLFEPWGIRDEILGILDSWYAPSNPVAIAILDNHMIEKEGKMPTLTTPTVAGSVYRSFIETLPKD